MLNGGEPVVVSFRALAAATAVFHHWERRWLDALHDVWKRGAPTPDSIIRHPQGYDERQDQPGNTVTHIIPPPLLAQWLHDVSAARGMPLDMRQCLNMTQGKTDLALDMHTRPLLFEMRTHNG